MLISIDSFNSDLKDIINSATDRYNQGENVEKKTRISTLDIIPLVGNTWWKFDDITCVYIDMVNSSKLSAQMQDKFTAGVYQFFTGTAVKILNHFDASYIDVKGDGAFGIFNQSKFYHALSAAVTFKTFSEAIFSESVNVGDGDKVSCHIGMDKKTVLVKKVGLQTKETKTQRNNEVWAGKPVNMAAKLAQLGGDNDLIVSERVFDKFFNDNSSKVLLSCERQEKLWETIELGFNDNFDFSKAYKLKSPGWCSEHGPSFCEEILKLDEQA